MATKGSSLWIGGHSSKLLVSQEATPKSIYEIYNNIYHSWDI